jgi:hypothetical protein
MNDDPNDLEKFGKLKAWSEGAYDGRDDDDLIAWVQPTLKTQSVTRDRRPGRP